MPYDGAPDGVYVRAVEALSGSLMRHNAAVIELSGEDSVVVRCALESAKMYFKARGQCGSWGKPGRLVYAFRAGRYEIFSKFVFFLKFFLIMLIFLQIIV